MAISITRYVDITSGVGGAAIAQTRALIARIFSSNLMIPTQAVVEMTTLQDVAEYFGTSSQEYACAAFYFGYVSKTATSPNRISFASYQPAAIAARVFGGKSPSGLAAFQTVAAGQMIVTIGSSSYTMTNINTSTAASLSDVANILQTAIQSGPGAVFTGATVSWNSTANRFELVAGAVGANAIRVSTTATGTQMATMLQWTEGAGAIWADGTGAQTPVDAVIKATGISNNYGSFCFVPSLTLEQVTAVAQWNDAQNVSYLYSVPLFSDAPASTWYNALKDISGICLTLNNVATANTEFPEMAPMCTLAATDYTRINATQNYMFQQYQLQPLVFDDVTANTYDGLRVNYYGQTQQAGNNISFYQRGVMMGLATDPVDINVYVNEMWFKDAITVSLMNLLLALPRVPANAEGQGQLVAATQSVIEIARINGVISAGKPISSTQQAFITLITNDTSAWREVQSQGYWFNIAIQQVGTEFHAIYTLVYSKDDAIRKVTGSNILI